MAATAAREDQCDDRFACWGARKRWLWFPNLADSRG